MQDTHIRARIITHRTNIHVGKHIVHIPGSKSHTIRGLLFAGLAEGQSTLHNALDSGDTQSCITLLRALGVGVSFVKKPSSETPTTTPTIVVESTGMQSFIYPPELHAPINLGNSGTTLYFATALAALSTRPISLDGDASLRTRSALPLLEALEGLGATISMEEKGCLPYSLCGPISPGEIEIECSTSQYLSALLIALSLLEGRSTIKAQLSGEFPYVDMTCMWLKKHGIQIEKDENYQTFVIPGGGKIESREEHIYGDFSSAAFFLGLSALSGHRLVLGGLEYDETQADMKVLDILKAMGCEYAWLRDDGAESGDNDSVLEIKREGDLVGGEFDLSEIPDSLPILTVVAAYANSPTTFYNVAHARKKETDRISVMCGELKKLGVETQERDDGLVVIPNEDSCLQGGEVDSHHDHRIAMALACGATRAKDNVVIHNADASAVTFPSFYEELKNIGEEVEFF